MRILFTGLTSFTGFWFVKELVDRGHEVVSVMRGRREGYSDLRAERLGLIEGKCETRWGAAFGSAAFLSIVNDAGPFDVLCHHAADTTDYKSPNFDVLAAVANNTRSIASILGELAKCHCRRIVLTGSVFEANEGGGSHPMRAFSPYGLSKTLTSQIFSYHAEREGFGLGKFVIPNPFGPYEEPRFTDYLVRCWTEGKPARVNTSAYIRDNIHVSLLALAYADFVESVPAQGFVKSNPSGYIESQGAFAQRFADEIGPRLGLDCGLELAIQTEFPEPLARINTDVVSVADGDWSEDAAWTGLADYYRRKFGLERD